MAARLVSPDGLAIETASKNPPAGVWLRGLSQISAHGPA